jgi:ABC-type branched-subunit amino acid transport system substrate-binding protein
MLKRVRAFGVAGVAIAAVVAASLSGTASARSNAAAASVVSCKAPVAIGFAYPATGPAAGIGAFQNNWANQAVTTWNKSHSVKIKLVPGDTQLGNGTTFAVAVAHSFASNQAIVAVTGPAGSQEQQDTASIWHSAGLAPISGSETRVELTRSQPHDASGNHPRETTPGYFFRTVPNDGQQGQNDADYIHNGLKAKKVLIIDDSEAYSTGLRDQVKADLKADKVTVFTNHITQSDTDFSSVINAIPSGTQVIYIPWQLANQAQNFYTQLHNHGKNIPLFGSDGTDDSTQFKGAGSYVSDFPYSPTASIVKSFSKAHGGDAQSFGIPSYTSVLVNATAIQAECKAHGNKINRTEVRKEIPKVTLTSGQSLLGFSVAFLAKNQGKFQGPGDMGGKAGFGIYKIGAGGKRTRVG